MTVYCSLCPAFATVPRGQIPAGWIWTERLRVCGDCHRRVVGRKS